MEAVTKNKLPIDVTYKNKMKTYCVKCRKDTESIDPKMVRTKNNRLIMQVKCSVCGTKKWRFVKEQEAKGLLSNLEIETTLSKIPLLNVLFWMQFHWSVHDTSCKQSIKMNEIVNKVLVVGDKFISEMHLKQPSFTYSACGPFTQKKKELKNLRKLEIQILFIEMNLIKPIFNMIWLMEKQKM